MPWSSIGPYPGAYYKGHYACFRCRKMVRKLSIFEMTSEQREAARLGQIKCPECSQLLRSMGKAFRPPRQTAVREWRKIEEQYQQGVRWPNGRW